MEKPELTNIVPVNVDGVDIINTTPHEITFGVGDHAVVNVPPMVLINAAAKEKPVRNEDGVELVKTVFEATDEGKDIIAELKGKFANAVIVGSIIAAQAFPGDVVGMTPCPGFERVPPAEKRMNPHKFTTFE